MSKDGDTHNELLEELKRITKILVLIAAEGKTQKEQIAILDRVGFAPKDIAELLGTTRNTVSVALVDIRKKSKRSSK